MPAPTPFVTINVYKTKDPDSATGAQYRAVAAMWADEAIAHADTPQQAIALAVNQLTHENYAADRLVRQGAARP